MKWNEMNSSNNSLKYDHVSWQTHSFLLLYNFWSSADVYSNSPKCVLSKYVGISDAIFLRNSNPNFFLSGLLRFL